MPSAPRSNINHTAEAFVGDGTKSMRGGTSGEPPRMIHGRSFQRFLTTLRHQHGVHLIKNRVVPSWGEENGVRGGHRFPPHVPRLGKALIMARRRGQRWAER